MKVKALITLLVLGSSSVAMARPYATPVVRDHRAPTIVDDCYQPAPAPSYPAPRPAPRPSWLTLGTVNQIIDGEMPFAVRSYNAKLSTLKLQNLSGKTLVNRVLIQFANGRTQTVELNQYLMAGSPTLTIDLKGESRNVTKVTVVGRNARQSAYSVLAV